MESTSSWVCWFSAPSIALSDKKSCTPDPPSHVSSASVPSTPVEEGVYSELGDPAENYDKLHPYSNRDADRQPYAEFAPRARDVSKPDVDSAYVNTALPMGKEDSTFWIIVSRSKLTPTTHQLHCLGTDGYQSQCLGIDGRKSVANHHC